MYLIYSLLWGILMNKLLVVFVSGMMFTSAYASCYGSSNYYTCNDPQSGNHYTISKYGDTTSMQGYNSSTGSTWSQSSRTYGNTTYQNGYSSDGGIWNQTIRNNGSSTTYSGTDSDGNFYHKTCTRFGCY